MTNVFISGGGGSGVGSDDCTATAADVRKGKTFVGADTNDETGVGTLDISDFDLDGTAAVGDVLSGKTFYSDNAASKRTGTLSLSGTAATSDVLSGKTFYNNDAKTKQTGSLTLDNVMAEVGTDVYIRVWSEVKWTNPGGYLWWESKKTADAHVSLWENWMSADTGTNLKWGDGGGAYLTGINIYLPSIGLYTTTPTMQLSEGADVYSDSAYGNSQTSGATYMSVNAGTDGKKSTVFDNRNLKIVLRRNDDASKYAVILISTSKGTPSTSARIINFTIRNQYFNNSTVSDFTGGIAGARYRLWIKETDA